MQLEDDMVTMKSEPIKLIHNVKEADGTEFENHPFLEASSMRKIRDKYYLIYSSNKMHELCYAISDHPDSDFRFGGVIISNAEIHPEAGQDFARNIIGNNHGSIALISDSYYIFYHRQTTLRGSSRQGCAEKIEVLKDGSIPQVELTSNGMEDAFAQKGTYPAALRVTFIEQCSNFGFFNTITVFRSYITQNGADYSPGDGVPQPRQYIANMQNHSAAVFRYFDLDISGLSVAMRGVGTGTLFVKEHPDSEAFASIELQPSLDWRVYSVELAEMRKINTLSFCYEGEGTQELLEFTLV
jgi:hypothetical protein